MAPSRAAGIVGLAVVLGVSGLAAPLPISSQTRTDPQARSVSGRVVDSKTGQPVEGVLVIARANSNLSLSSEVTTDSLGRFKLSDVPDELFEIYAFVDPWDGLPPGEGRYGQKTFDAPSTWMRVRRGQSVSGITVPFFRHAVVGGRVNDEFGNPLSHAHVEFLTRGAVSGRRSLIPGPGPLSIDTDDLGLFRLIFPPGDVFIRVSSEERRTTLSDDFARTEVRVFPSVFVGGGSRAADAKPVTLNPGDERLVDVQLVSQPSVEISGVVVDDKGPVAGALLTLENAPEVGTEADRMGRFRMRGVTAGDHVLVVQAGGIDHLQYARVSLGVGEHDVTGLVVTLRPFPIVSGRVVLDGEVENPQPIHGYMTWFLPDQRPRSPGLMSREAGSTFSLRVQPGLRMLQFEFPPEGLTVKSVTISDRDITDKLVEISGDVDNVVVTLTNRLSAIRGRVIAPDDVPINSISLCVFPADPRRWIDFGPDPARIPDAYIGLDGTFDVGPLPAGRYVALALRGNDVHCVRFDSNWFRFAAALGTHVSLESGQQATIELRPASLPRPVSETWTPDERTALPAPPANIRTLNAAVVAVSPVVIRGIVRDAGTGSPLAGVELSLPNWPSPTDSARSGPPDKSVNISAWPDLVRDSGADRDSRISTTTDERGRFALTDIDPGRYRIQLSKPGYIAHSYPATDDLPLVVSSETATLNVNISLEPAAVVNGIITDTRSRPLMNCDIAVRKANLPANDGTVERGTSTDDRGAYRIPDLPPGEYVLGVCQRDRIPFELRAGESRMINVTVPARTPPPGPQ